MKMNIRRLLQPSLSINKRLMLLIVFCIGIPVFMMGWLWYTSSTGTIEQSSIDTNKRIIEQTNKYLDLYISNLENSTYPFVNHPQIQQFLDAPALTPYQYYSISEKVENDLFAQMIYGRSDIMGMSLVTHHQRQITDFSEADKLIDMREIRTRNISLLNKMDSLDNYQVLGVSSVGSTPVLTVARKLNSSSSYLYKGLLIIDLNLRQIENIFENASPGGFTVWIASKNGDIVYHPDESLMGTHVSSRMLEQIQTGESGYFRYDQSSREDLVIYENSQITDWIVVADIPLRTIIGNLIHLRNLSLIAAVILVLITLSVVGGYSLFLTRSLTFLQRLMSHVESGDFTVRSHSNVQRKDEVGSVYRSFFKMVSELNRLVKEVHSSKIKEQELIIKQKESALQSMQSHINPHFLYNSLEIINSHAIIEGNRDISRMTGALAHMFRYNIGNAAQIVSLQEELTHIQSYLMIQQARFRNLKVDIQLDQEMWGSRISTVRLTLQPLIENAFIHGYQGKKPTYIGIIGEACKGYFSLRVIDHGIGMPAGVLDDLQNSFGSINLDRQSINTATSGIGLLNVHDRLRLTFGNDYGLYILHSSGEGTSFEIRLPYNYSQDQEGVI